MNRKTITLITYSSFTTDTKRYYVNRALGILLDQLGNFFEKIYYVASKADKDSNLYASGKSVYSYIVRSPNVVFVGIKDTAGMTKLLKKIILTARNQIVIKTIIKRSDLVYVFLPSYSNLIAGFIAKFYKKPLLLYFGSSWDETGPLRIDGHTAITIIKKTAIDYYSLLERSLAKKAILCLAAGKKLLDYYSKVNNFTYDVVPMVQFTKLLDKNTIIKGSAKFKNKLAVLYVGTINENKGIKYLIEAISLLILRNIRVELFVVGTINRSYMKQLEQHIFDNSNEKHIHFVGYISDAAELEKYYLKSDIFVIPSLGEGFPRVIYEAMLSGIPVIASDLQSIRANLPEPNLVSLVPPRNPQAIAEAIIHLWLNEKQRKTQIEKARIFASSKLQGNPANQLIHLLQAHKLI